MSLPIDASIESGYVSRTQATCNVRHRLAAVAVAGLVWGFGGAVQPAFAAEPANDTQAGAVEISAPLPFHYTEDTTDATVDSGESVAQSMCLGAGAPAFEHAVWFHATVPPGVTRR